jgi:hypothetical protein
MSGRSVLTLIRVASSPDEQYAVREEPITEEMKGVLDRIHGKKEVRMEHGGKSMKELAQEALDVQNACNLSGVVHGFSRAISRLRELLPNAGTDEINSHPICVAWADKIASLTGIQEFSDYAGIRARHAFNLLFDLVEGTHKEDV